MAFITAETRSDLIALSVGMLKQAPSNALLEELIALSVDGGTLADAADHIAKTDAFKAEYPSFQTASQYAAEIFDNITTGGTVTAEIRTAVIDLATGYLTSGAYSKAGLALAIVDFLSQPAALLNSDFADIAQSVQNRSAAAEYFVVTKELGGSTDAELAAAVASVTSDAATLTAANAAADATADAVAVVPGQTFTLTTSLDTGASFTGGTGDDTFTAQETSTATTDTLTTGDNIDGGEGTDTFTVAVSGTPAGGVTNGVRTTNIEAVSVYNNSTAAYEVDAALMAGLSDVYINGGTFATTVDDVNTLANLHLISTNVNAELSTTAAAVAGAADEVTVLSNNSALTANVTATYDGVEVINFNAAGATGSYSLAKALAGTAYSLTLDSNQLEKVVVTGDADANLTVDLTGADLETQTSEFDASAAGGSITAHITKGDSATAAVTMSAQADHLDFNGALVSTITLDGGDGVDTLELDTDVGGYTAAAAAAGTLLGTGVSNFEVLQLASGVDVDERALPNNAGITSVIAIAGGSYTKSTALASITQISTGAFTTTAATDGAADALTINLAGAGVTSTLSAANVETLTVGSAGTAANAVTMSAAGSADLTSITAAGSKGLTLTISGTSLATVDASGITGVGSAFTLVASASDADMTVTASANRPTVAETGTANTITTGDGDDTVTGGIYKDVIVTGNGDDTVTSGNGNDDITTGRGDDTITAGDGDVDIDAGIGNDTVVVGGGDNTIDLGSGDDTLTTGNGDNEITLGAGDDTVTAGSGDDTVIMTDYDDDDVIDLGTGTNILVADALPTTGAYAAAADFVDTSGDIAPQLSNVDALYLQHATADGNDGVDTKETITLTASTGLTALYLDINDGDADDNSVYDIVNFDGSQLHLSQTAGESPDVLNVDGTGQSALLIKTYDFNATAGTDIVVTQVDALTVDTYETVTVSGATSLVTDTTLGAITADGSDSVTIKTDSIAGTLGGIATLTVGAVSADSAQTLALTAGSNTELVVGAVTSTSAAVDAITLTAADDGVIDLTSIDVTNSDLSTLTVTAGIGARIDLDGAGDTLPITADSIEAATFTLGAASVSAFDLLYGGTTTIALTTGSTLDLDDIGVAAVVSSTTITGRGTLQGDLDLLGTATFRFSGFTSTGGGITVDGASAGNKTIIGNNAANTFLTGAGTDSVTGGAGVDTFVTSAGDDTFTGGAGADIYRIADGDEGGDTLDYSTVTDDVIQFVTDDVAAGGTSDLFDEGAVVFANTDGTDTAGTVVALNAGDYNEIAATGTVADNKVNIITDSTGFASVEAALNSIDDGAGDVGDNLSFVIGFWNSANEAFEIHYVSDSGTAAADFADEASEELVTLTGVASTTIAASVDVGNFAVYSLG